ncbi:BIG/ATPase V1 complex, subunit S1 [Stachybotrys elegans]|uniref:Protein BIG1 n=1 Tax=Stachybotrys elegans TaxID=80388 RepID=A0A8K0ST86_9HYPO|nr:BIG/ATPase V1 complex, subunit S1 [Stachybotrys elegans]
MRTNTLVSALALAGSSAAFSDTTPFALLSTSTFANDPTSNQLQSSSTVLKYTAEFVASCPTDRYLIVTQPGINAGELRSNDACALPSLCNAADASSLQGRYIVSEVVGAVAGAGISAMIETACSQKEKKVTIEEVNLSSLSQEDRVESLAENDAVLSSSLKRLTTTDSYTIVFLSTPGEPTSYKADFGEAMHTDLKRGIKASHVRRDSNNTDWDRLPVFEKYQFFTPGIWMALVTAIILLGILYVGLSALTSLEVSYGAFDKDMGPAAQKKQQ